MKPILHLLICILIQTVSLSAQNWDEDHHVISLYQTGSSINYQLGDSAYTNIGSPNHIMLRWDWILPEQGFWGYGDGTGLLHIITGLSGEGKANDIYASLAEVGFGVMFNNKRPITIGKVAQIKIGMGLSFGVKGFRTVKSTETVGIGSFPLEIASFMQLGNRVFIFPKVGFQPLYNGETLGGRVFFDMKSTVKVFDWLGVNLTLGTDRYNYNGEHKVSQNNAPLNAELDETFKFSYFQLGVVFIK